MDFGIALPTPAHSWKLVKRAEDSGFSTAWSGAGPHSRRLRNRLYRATQYRPRTLQSV